MCGIVGIVAQREIANLLVGCLHRLEYRGYDSAGLAVVDRSNHLHQLKVKGKVDLLASALREAPLSGTLGIAHTRWATHGAPSEVNAHPHASSDNVAVVHNGIIENFDAIKKNLLAKGYKFVSDTDTEVVAHLIDLHLQQENNTLQALRNAIQELKGAFSLAVVLKQAPERVFAISSGCPLVIGLGADENYVASDQLALLPLTRRFIYMEDHDIAEISDQEVKMYNAQGEPVSRSIALLEMSQQEIDKGDFRHYMQKEIYEQPTVIQDTLAKRVTPEMTLAPTAFEPGAREAFSKLKAVHIIACGTSFHAGLVARYWLEALAGVPCLVEIASEYRYRDFTVPANTLFVSISQSGETADTIAALKKANTMGYLASLAICNVETSTLVRASDFSFLTHAGPEIGVASTKAFTTQLIALMMLTIAIGREHHMSDTTEHSLIEHLSKLPHEAKEVLALDETIHGLVAQFISKQHMLFLGRGVYYPVAKEGALKVKELSYIHAEAYPAGELKHGPLALVDNNMPVIAIADNDALLQKLCANLKEVSARGGQLFVFTNTNEPSLQENGITLIPVPIATGPLSPILYTIPLQLFAYHVAVQKGTDVDQPRNLAKSVTVE